jgi:pimeloyl-ACP methyl ester carboxylesterase
MYYEESGRGEPLILHYGTGGDHAAWEPQVRELSHTFRVITPDPRGTGRTRGSTEEWTLALLAADIVALMNALSIPRAHVGGMSMGAAVCQELAIRNQERVKTLVLSNTWGRTDARLRLFWEHSLFLMDQADKATGAERDRWQEMLYRHGICLFFSPDALANRTDLIEKWWTLYSGGLRAETGAGHWHAMLRHDALERLSQITAPTLVLAGEEDYFTPYYPRQVHAHIPQAVLVCLTGPGSSHGLLWERAHEANAIIRRFICDRT